MNIGQKTSLIIQIITTLLFLVMIIPALLNIMAGLMGMVAEGGSTAWQVVSGLVTLLSALYPFAALGCILGSWVLYASQRYSTALWISLIPGAWIVLVVLLMAILFGVISPSLEANQTL